MIKFIRKSIKAELFALFSITLLIVIGLSILLNTVFLESYYIYKNEQEFVSIAKIVEASLSSGNTEAELFELDRSRQVSILVVDEKHAPIIASYKPESPFTVHLEREILHILYEERDAIKTKYFYDNIGTQQGENLMFISKTEKGYYIVLTKALIPVNDNINIMNEFYIMSGFFAIVVASIFSIKFFDNFTKSIIEVSRITKNIANMDFGEKVVYDHENEVGELSKSVNLLSQKLEENINTLQNEVEFQKVFSRNVSHELKTPIAVVKGYAEGLFYGVADTKEMENQYLTTIIEECDRMSLLVQDILLLSKLSATTDKVETMEIIQSSVIEEKISSAFSMYMKSYGIDFTMDIVDIEIFANVELIVQLMTNFLSNAIKYGDKKKIELTMVEDELNIIVKVFNTGDLILEENLKKIFDEFYTVDEARSRDIEGHGLGLAISKSIAEFHSGKIYAKNELDGISFVLEFPKIQKSFTR